MKRTSIKSSLQLIALAVGLTGAVSCKEAFDLDPKNAIVYENNYQNIYDADAAVTGIYGQFLTLAKQYEVLNELRADLMSVTVNADAHLREIGSHTVTEGNPYANPRPFYMLILNCNDVLKNLEIMKNDNRITRTEYDHRMSDIVAVRSFLYFQLGLHFGEVPYITTPIQNVADLESIKDYPRTALEPLVDKLIETMVAIPYKLPYPTSSSMFAQIDGYPTKMLFINKNALLGDLYLFRNNYNQAARAYKEVLETTTPLGSGAGYVYYNTYIGTSGTDNDAVTASAWQTFMSRSPNDREFQAEWIWTMFFDKNFQPQNPFIELFANVGGKYLLKPSNLAIEKWQAQTQTNDTPFDLRGENNSYKIINGQPVVMKFLYNYLNANTGLPTNILERNGKWLLYRASLLHLRYSEAANRDMGLDKIGYGFMNNGLINAYNKKQNMTAPDDKQATFLDFPYDLDARKLDAPTHRGKYHRNLGLRRRVNVKPNLIDSLTYFDMYTDPKLHNKPLKVGMEPAYRDYFEDKLIEEAALELAFEGNRWQDLVRIAIRRNDDAYLADKIRDKLRKEGNPAAEQVHAKLLDRQNWFLPFKWE